MENTASREKSRSKNFIETEVKLLLELVDKYKSVVECKKTDLVSSREKEATWQKIEQEFNNASGIYYRDLKILKSKYENKKKLTKRKFADAKRYAMGTGGGPSMKTPDISEVDIKINDIVGDLVLSGQVSKFDSDTVDSDLTQVQIERENQDVGLSTSLEFDNMPVVLEEEVVENILSTGHSRSPPPQRFQGLILSQSTISDGIEPDGETTSGGLFKLLDSPKKRRTEEPTTTSTAKTEIPVRHTAFTMRDLSKKTSPPLLIGTRKKKSALDSSMAGKKIEGISDAKKEVIDLQKELYKKQIQFLEEDHLLKTQFMREKHMKEQRLLDLEIQKKELKLNF